MSPVLALKMGHRSRAIDFVEWDAMKSTPIRFVVAISLALLFAGLAVRAQDSHFSPNDQQIPAPDCLSAAKDLWIAGVRLCTPADHEAWLADIRHWRDERRIRIGYDGSRYEILALQWAQSSFIQPQMMVQDRYFYDPVAGKYTVGRYLDDLEKRYGGIDSALIWPT